MARVHIHRTPWRSSSESIPNPSEWGCTNMTCRPSCSTLSWHRRASSPPTRPAQSPDPPAVPRLAPPPLPPAQVVQSAVCHVGVDLNTASTSLLMHIGGLNASRAAAIVAARPAGGFTSRASLRAIKGIGPKTFEQVAALNEPHDLMAFACL